MAKFVTSSGWKIPPFLEAYVEAEMKKRNCSLDELITKHFIGSKKDPTELSFTNLIGRLERIKQMYVSQIQQIDTAIKEIKVVARKQKVVKFPKRKR